MGYWAKNKSMFLNLGFVGAWIFTRSNESTRPDAAINYRFIACRLNTAEHVSGILMVVLCCWSWSVRSDRPRPTALLPPRSYGKPEEAAAAGDRLLMMGIRMPETC